MSIFRPHTGNDAEDKMAEAFGCIVCGCAFLLALAVGVGIELYRWLA